MSTCLNTFRINLLIVYCYYVTISYPILSSRSGWQNKFVQYRECSLCQTDGPHTHRTCTILRTNCIVNEYHMNDILTVSDVPHEAKLFRWAPHCWHSPVAQPHIRLVTKHLLQEFTSFFRPQSEEISAIMEQSIVWWILWIHNAFPRKLRTFLTRAMILTLALDYYQSILPVFSNTSQPISQVTALHQHQSTHNSLAFVESFCDFMIAGRLCLMIPCPLPWSPSPTDFTSRPGSYFMFFFSLGMFWVLPVHSFFVFRSLFCCILFFFFF